MKIQIQKNKLLVAGGAVAVVLIGGIASFFYFGGADYLPIPVARVNGHFILKNDYEAERKGYEHFLETMAQGEIDDDEVYQSVMSRLIFNSIVRDEVKRLGLSTPTKADLDAMYEQILVQQQKTDEEMQELIKTTYGWSKGDFYDHILEPQKYTMIIDEELQTATDKLPAEYVHQDDMEVHGAHIFLLKSDDEKANVAAKKSLESVLADIAQGASFETYAESMNQDLTQSVSGDFGWILASDVDEQFFTALSSLPVDGISDTVIESENGYHILKKLEERPFVDINTYMKDAISNAPVNMYWGLENPVKAEQS